MPYSLLKNFDEKRSGKKISDEKFKKLYENFSGTDTEFARIFK